jgi:hypothetical protein
MKSILHGKKQSITNNHSSSCNALACIAALLLAAVPAAKAADYQLPYGYHPQQTSFFCGPATMQMILDTPAVLGNYINPVLPSQLALYNSAQANNLEPGSPTQTAWRRP